MAVLATNKSAGFNYKILDKFEAGLVLNGSEVKSIRQGKVNLKGSYISYKIDIKKKSPSFYLVNSHIPRYKNSQIKDYDPFRDRKLLLKKREIANLIGKVKTQGLTLIPTKIYTKPYNKKSLIKLEFALAQGKKKFDKREDIKKKDLDRQKRHLLKKRIKEQR